MVVDHQKEEEYNPSDVEALPITDDGGYTEAPKTSEMFLEKGVGVINQK